jgi:histidinol-phosphate phosphatase family protein
MPYAKQGLKMMRAIFGKLIVVTNQQGIGKGLMTNSDLMKIHWQMETELITDVDVRLDAVYHCPDLASSNSPNRKPEIGMALQAKKDFPTINFQKSLIIGDSISDMEFGKKAGMFTLFLSSSQDKAQANEHLIDLYFSNWIDVIQYFAQMYLGDYQNNEKNIN